MFDISWSELVVIAVVALVVIGPKELPGVLRGIGHWMGKIRRMAGEFQNQFQDAMREAEMADLKKNVDDLNSAASSLTDFNPMADAQKEIDRAFEMADKPVETPPPETPTAEAALPAPSPVNETELAPSEPAPTKQTGGGA